MTHPSETAVALALLVGWWAGALVNRQYAKGVVLGIVTVASAFAFGFPCALVVWVPGWILGAIDTRAIAYKLWLGQAVDPFEFWGQKTSGAAKRTCPRCMGLNAEHAGSCAGCGHPFAEPPKAIDTQLRSANSGRRRLLSAWPYAASLVAVVVLSLAVRGCLTPPLVNAPAALGLSLGEMEKLWGPPKQSYTPAEAESHGMRRQFVNSWYFGNEVSGVRVTAESPTTESRVSWLWIVTAPPKNQAGFLGAISVRDRSAYQVELKSTLDNPDVYSSLWLGQLGASAHPDLL